MRKSDKTRSVTVTSRLVHGTKASAFRVVRCHPRATPRWCTQRLELRCIHENTVAAAWHPQEHRDPTDFARAGPRGGADGSVREGGEGSTFVRGQGLHREQMCCCLAISDSRDE